MSTKLSLEERFMSFVHPEPNSGCWLWLGALGRHGYGLFYANNRLRRASHVSLEIFKDEPRPNGLNALHSCDNPSCVNSDHLRWGTQQENMDDVTARGRWPKTRKAGAYKTHCKRGHLFDAENTYIKGDGSRECRACVRDRNKTLRGTRNEYYRNRRALARTAAEASLLAEPIQTLLALPENGEGR